MNVSSIESVSAESIISPLPPARDVEEYDDPAGSDDVTPPPLLLSLFFRLLRDDMALPNSFFSLPPLQVNLYNRLQKSKS